MMSGLQPPLPDERTSTPAAFKDLDNVSPYLLLLCLA